MKIDVLSLFPEMFEGFLTTSIIKRAIDSGHVEVTIHNFREFATDRHKSVDDTPYGGGQGMVLMCKPLLDCLKTVVTKDSLVILMSPQGMTHHQAYAEELALKQKHIVIICGHYEGFDNRVVQNLADEVISIGDYVLTGGELPAMVVIDAVSRMLPGVLGSGESAPTDSFYNGLLEYPQYTKPREYRGLSVPDVLLSGDHAKIAKWRRQESLRVTYTNRPDLHEKVELSKDDKKFLEELKNNSK